MKGLAKAHHPAALDVASNRHARSALTLSVGPGIDRASGDELGGQCTLLSIHDDLGVIHLSLT
jgi:hypothetical protein